MEHNFFMNNQKTIDVSAIVVAYNFDMQKMTETLDSIFMQKSVSFEIIVTDDGSKNNHEKELIDYFNSRHFSDYHLVLNQTNQGTVKNLLSGIEIAVGKYIKGISPGDYLSDENALRSSIDFLENSSYRWCFSDYFCYTNDNDKMTPVSAYAYPQDLKPYLAKNSDRCRWNYLVLNDKACGVCFFSETELEKQYLKEISDNGVIYTEDNMWRLMMFDGIVGGYHPEATVYYEYGDGISTGKSEVWKQRIASDIEITNQLIREREEKDEYQKKMVRQMNPNRGFLEKVFTKGKILFWIKKRFATRYTKTIEL